jgi:hypothetical protein
MTVIVGLVDNGNVYIGGDSAGVAGLSVSIRADEKVFHNGPFIIGITSSFRMGQLLRYRLDAPKQTTNQTDMEYMVTDFIDAVRKCFADGGFGTTAANSDHVGGTFLVGYNGSLYHIGSDFQVGQPLWKYDSVGCGSDIAKGSLFSSKEKSPEVRLKLSLEASAAFSGGVLAPFYIVKQLVAKTKRKAKK